MHPILEDNTLVCLHGGRVKLKAKKAKRIKSDNVSIMLDNEIQGASISGCLNPPILGGPCTKVAMVFAYTYSDHKVNHKHSVLQMGLIGMSIKGYPILAIPKKNKIKFALAKIQANPLAKIKWDKIRWEGGGGKLGAAQRRRREKSKEKAKMLLYLENENKNDSKIKQISISNIPKNLIGENLKKIYQNYTMIMKNRNLFLIARKFHTERNILFVQTYIKMVLALKLKTIILIKHTVQTI